MSTPPSAPLLRGPLVPESFARTRLVPCVDDDTSVGASRLAFDRYRRWWARTAGQFGPASPVRALHELAAVPLVRLLGHRVADEATRVGRDRVETLLRAAAGTRLALVTMSWGVSADIGWRGAVALGTRAATAWGFCFTGRSLVLVDVTRPYARRFVDIDLAVAAASLEAFNVLRALAGAEALGTVGPRPSTLERTIAEAARHERRTCVLLDRGVREAQVTLRRALARRGAHRHADAPRGGPALHDQALTVIFRLLFLLFAEARGLLPLDHPLYRESYSLAARRSDLGDHRARGWWPALRALMRMAHAGCRIRGLEVTAFNGRLFDPAHAPAAERTVVDDHDARAAFEALATAPGPRQGGRVALPYADLDVEQLGAIYERLIDEPEETPGGPDRARATRGTSRPPPRQPARKATGSFYTPRPLTEFLVRRTLAPLVEDVPSASILELRIVDPAMGSGAVLVAACRYLASAYERAIVAEGQARPGDLSAADRAGFHRLVATRCLYGVDLNPMAVHLARLSLWLTTLARDRPLTFLDHRLRVGDSLVGAGPHDLARQPPGRGGRRRAPAVLPLLTALDLPASVAGSVAPRRWMATTPDDTVDAVRGKEAALARLEGADGPLARWTRAADAWCAGWFWPGPRVPSPAVLGDLVAAILSDTALPRAPHRDALAAEVARTAEGHHFFHWEFAFPEVFAGEDGVAREDAGFDAVLGNPPWDMLRAEPGADRARTRALAGFVRESGLYVSGRDAHVNRYQLFVERALDLLRPGGRLGLIVPWGLFADAGSAALRTRLLDRADLDALVWFENRRAIFPIHRSVRFAVWTATGGRPTRAVACRPAETEVLALDGIPDRGQEAPAFPLVISRAALDELGMGPLAVPAVRSPEALALLLRLHRSHPALADPAGWHVRFGRELNATDDRGLLVPAGTGLPVVEGKHLRPFVVDTARAAWRLPAAAARRRPALHLDRPRVAFRDVASPGNRQTLIAAILPAGVVSTHTVFCLRTPLDEPAQQVLCALLNSLVANWMARLWVGTHVTLAIVHRLPVPRPDPRDPLFEELASLARRCAVEGVEGTAGARLHVAAARAFGVGGADLDIVLDACPQLDAGLREAVRQGVRAAT